MFLFVLHFAITFQMLESFIYTHTEITNSFYVVQSKMIIQSNLVVYYS